MDPEHGSRLTRAARVTVTAETPACGDIDFADALCKAGDAAGSWVNRLGREFHAWLSQLLARADCDHLRITLEFDAWRSRLIRTRRVRVSGTAELDVTICRESRTARTMSPVQRHTWAMQLVAESLLFAGRTFGVGAGPAGGCIWSETFPCVSVVVEGALGRPDGPWHRRPSVDAWLHRARLGSDLLSMALRDDPPASGLSPELIIRPRPADTASVGLGADGHAAVMVADAFTQMSADEQRTDVVRTLVRALELRGALDGFDPRPTIARARARLQSAETTITRASPWRPHPDGRHRARWIFEQGWSGLGFLRVQLADPDGIVAESAWVAAGPTADALSELDLSWSDDDAYAEVEAPHVVHRSPTVRVRVPSFPRPDGHWT